MQQIKFTCMSSKPLARRVDFNSVIWTPSDSEFQWIDNPADLIIMYILVSHTPFSTILVWALLIGNRELYHVLGKISLFKPNASLPANAGEELKAIITIAHIPLWLKLSTWSFTSGT